MLGQKWPKHDIDCGILGHGNLTEPAIRMFMIQANGGWFFIGRKSFFETQKGPIYSNGKNWLWTFQQPIHGLILVKNGSWWIGFSTPGLTSNYHSSNLSSPQIAIGALISLSPYSLHLFEKKTKFPPTRPLLAFGCASKKKLKTKTSKIAIAGLAIESSNFLTSSGRRKPLSKARRDWWGF